MSKNFVSKGPYLRFYKLYHSKWVVTIDFRSINLPEGKANKTPRDTIFIHDVLYQEHLHDLLQETLYSHCYKVSIGHMKECNCCHNWFHKVYEVSLVKMNFLKLTVRTNGFVVTAYSPVPNNSPPCLLVFRFFVGSPFSLLSHIDLAGEMVRLSQSNKHN